MRLFVALDIDDAIRERIHRFMDGVRGFAPDANWVRPESLHVTLKFVGEKPAESVEEIKDVLSRIDVSSTQIKLRGCGFFPTPKAARVFWVGIEAEPQLADLAQKVDDATACLNILRETHAFSPHLTLARGRKNTGAPRWSKGDGANTTFSKLQEKLAALPAPQFGTMTAREFFLYESQTGQGGARYTKIAGFQLA